MTFECYCDGEPATIYDARRHCAKKPYTCDECGGPIERGDKYERAQMLYDGHWSSFNTCADCLGVRDFVRINIPCFCFFHGSMLEDAERTVREAAAYAPEETTGLLFGFLRRKLVAQKRRLAKKARP